MSRTLKENRPKMIGVWGKDERYINREDLLIQGKSLKEVIKRILLLTTGAGFIDIFEVNDYQEEIKEFKRIYVEEELFFAYK